MSTLQKPDKIFLENSNLAFTLMENPDIGNVRETFVLNQLLNAGLNVNSPAEGDFIIGGLTIEVGGKGKNSNQGSIWITIWLHRIILKQDRETKYLSGYLVFYTNIKHDSGRIFS